MQTCRVVHNSFIITAEARAFSKLEAEAKAEARLFLSLEAEAGFQMLESRLHEAKAEAGFGFLPMPVLHI